MENNKQSEIVNEILKDNVFVSLDSDYYDKIMNGDNESQTKAKENLVTYLVDKYVRPLHRGTEISIENITHTFLTASRFIDTYSKDTAIQTLDEIANLKKELELSGYIVKDR
jgi:hypothetical protein